MNSNATQRPNNTPEQENKALEIIALVLGKMAKEEYGFEIKYELSFAKTES